ncbi:MAG: hypothetical protein Q8K32_11045 [Archangium sp.]|nr:hypothetical protein [Archangium sp.]
MARDRLLYDFKGLVTAPGRLARDEASCFATKNVVFPVPGLVEKRKGWRRLAAVTGGLPWKVFSTTDWGDEVLISTGIAAGAETLQFGNGTALWVPVLTPDGQDVRATPRLRVTGTQSLKSFYLTAQDAPLRLEPDLPSSFEARYAGMPRGLAANRNSALLAGTLLPNGYARAYRMTWHRYDASGVLLSGPPTARWVVRNRAGTSGYAGVTSDVQFGALVPCEWGTDATVLTTDYFFRLWATRTFNAAGDEEGDDEMYLVQERFLTAPEIAANSVTLDDSTPNDFLQRQLALNTNAINFPLGELGISQGIINADEPPPIAYDVVSWANVTWWADVRYRPKGFVTFLSVGAPNGLQDNDTITAQIGLTLITLRAKLVPALATDFQLYTGLATTQMNLEATAQAYSAILNGEAIFAGVGLRAYPVGLPSSQGGVVMIEASRLDPTGIGLQFVSSRATWYQYDGSGSGSGQATGYASEARNATCYSKPDRADAVPFINRFTAGPNNARIIKQQPYRNRLFLFTDQGVYVITGRSFADFAIEPFALDLKLLAREAVTVCDDAVYAWCTQGIAKISDGGWEIVSTPIEPTVTEAVRQASFNAPDGQLASLAFAIGDTEQHRVLFWHPEREVTTGDVRGCAFALVYDTRTGAWSQYDMVDTLLPPPLPSQPTVDFRAHGCVRASDGITLLTSERDNNPSEGWLYFERRDEAETTAYFDSYSDETAGPVEASIDLQFQTPDAGGAQHWLQTVVQLANNELTGQTSKPIPTQLAFTWTTESQTGAKNVVPSMRIVRVEPPRAVRRGNALSLKLRSAEGEYFGVVGIQQRFVPGSPWARGKTR